MCGVRTRRQLVSQQAFKADFTWYGDYEMISLLSGGEGDLDMMGGRT